MTNLMDSRNVGNNSFNSPDELIDMNTRLDKPSTNAVGCASNYKPKIMPFNETTYHSLLVMAENYRIAKPPRIRMCLQCLLAVLNINPPPQIQIRTHLQISNLLIRYTDNKQLAQSHLRAAITLANSTGDELAYFEAVSLLATTLCESSKPTQAKPILREGIAASQHNVYWHARLLLQLAHIHHEEGDHTSTQQLLDVGAELASNCRSDYLRILFLLSKGMVLLVQQKLEEVNLVLSMCGQLIDGLKNSSPMQVESHKVYFLTLQVAHLLSGGQVKSVKQSLKQLQQSIQEITALPSSACSLVPQENAGHIRELHEVNDLMKTLTSTDGFSWLPRDHMCILVYLVTVTYSLLAGYLDKAQKYTEKALKQIRKLKVTDSSSLLVQLELMFLEHMAQCHLIICDKKTALQQITEGCRLCVAHPNTPSITRHTMQMHTLLGMYCMSIKCMDDAEKHLQIALRKSVNNEQLVTNMLNLAMVYMHNYQLNNGRISQVKQQELVQLLSQINPDSVALKSRNLKAASFFVKGMFSFFQAIYSDAKRFLRETLKMANAQDLNRLTACALVLLGHIYLSVGNNQESVNMVQPAMQLANKIPDTSVKLWASALLRDLYRLCGDEENYKEYMKTHEKLATQLLDEQMSSPESSQHELIKWFTDDLPPVKLADVTDAKKIVNDASNSDSALPMEIESSSASGWSHSDENNSVTVPNSSDISHSMQTNDDLSSAAAIRDIKQSLEELPNSLTSNMNHKSATQAMPLRQPDLSIDTNSFYSVNAVKNDRIHKNDSTSQKFLQQQTALMQQHVLSNQHRDSKSSTSQDLNAKINLVGDNIFTAPLDSVLPMSSQQLLNQIQPHAIMDNNMPQQINPFVTPHQIHQNDLLKTTQGPAKVLGAQASYLTAGTMQGVVGNFSNISQQQAHLQALQQMQHSNELQQIYQHHGGATGFLPQQNNLGYPASPKVPLSNTNLDRRQQAWPSNQNHVYNMNNSNYSWR